MDSRGGSSNRFLRHRYLATATSAVSAIASLGLAQMERAEVTSGYRQACVSIP